MLSKSLHFMYSFEECLFKSDVQSFERLRVNQLCNWWGNKIHQQADIEAVYGWLYTNKG